MTFLKDFRRRSKASFRTSDSSKDSSNSVPSQKSSSTLNSAYASSTPPSSHTATLSNSNLTAVKHNDTPTAPPVPQRPSMTLNSSRNSMVVRETETEQYTSLIANPRQCRHPDPRALCGRPLPHLRSHPRSLRLVMAQLYTRKSSSLAGRSTNRS